VWVLLPRTQGCDLNSRGCPFFLLAHWGGPPLPPCWFRVTSVPQLGPAEKPRVFFFGLKLSMFTKKQGFLFLLLFEGGLCGPGGRLFWGRGHAPSIRFCFFGTGAARPGAFPKIFFLTFPTLEKKKACPLGGNGETWRTLGAFSFLGRGARIPPALLPPTPSLFPPGFSVSSPRKTPLLDGPGGFFGGIFRLTHQRFFFFSTTNSVAEFQGGSASTQTHPQKNQHPHPEHFSLFPPPPQFCVLLYWAKNFFKKEKTQKKKTLQLDWGGFLSSFAPGFGT